MKGQTLDDARAQLPRVGDRRMEIPTIADGSGYNEKPQPCVVIEVNEAHLWYIVRFENGFRESYKVPRLTTQRGETNE